MAENGGFDGFDMMTNTGGAALSEPAAARRAKIVTLNSTGTVNYTPTVAGETIVLGPQAAGAILGGSLAAVLVGHAPNSNAPTELLQGNAGNDTLRGGGGSGTIVSGSGDNVIKTGRGDMVVTSNGNDRITTGAGVDEVTAYGSATVVAGSGFTTFTDAGTKASHDKVHAGSGLTEMNSGAGADTFISGSGTAYMTDAGKGGTVAFQFSKGVGGTDIVQGFNPERDYIRVTSGSYGWHAFAASAEIVDGNAYYTLGTTKVEFIGFTTLSSSDFQT